jgi:hypothetical protein
LEDVAELLEETLGEEKAADEKLTDVGSEVLAEVSAGAVETESPKKRTNGKTASPGTKRHVG